MPPKKFPPQNNKISLGWATSGVSNWKTLSDKIVSESALDDAPPLTPAPVQATGGKHPITPDSDDFKKLPPAKRVRRAPPGSAAKTPASDDILLPESSEEPSEDIDLQVSLGEALEQLSGDEDNSTTPSKPSRGTLNPLLPKRAAAEEKPDELDMMTPVPRDQDARPEPCGLPPVWAESRAALCETLPYFRAYKGAAYVCEGRLCAMYLGNGDHDRSYIGKDVIVTRSQGCQGKVDKKMQQIKSAKPNEASIIAFHTAMKRRTPIVVLTGQDNMSCPSRPPHGFNVLDWFYVTDIWAEKNCGFLVFRYRLERVDKSQPAWWMPNAFPAPEESNLGPCEKQTCLTCQQEFKQVLSSGFLCLNHKCSAFWKLNGRAPTAAQTNGFNPKFIAERNHFPPVEVPFDIITPLLTITDGDAATGAAYCRDAWKGMCCPNCHGCSPRRFWEKWVCDFCPFTHELISPVLSARQVRMQHGITTTGHAADLNDFDETLITESRYRFGHFIFRKYSLGNGNEVWHIQSNSKINELPGGADDMFKAAQKAALDLERGSMHGKTGAAEHLVNHFASNFGATYKYAVAKADHAFSVAPDVILEGIARCTMIAKACVGEGVLAPNECLAVAYFEGGSMGFHDDGERGLESTVCAMSLGGHSIARLRIKDGPWKGWQKGGPMDPRIPIPDGAWLAEERRELNEKWRNTQWGEDDIKKYSIEVKTLHRRAHDRGIKTPANTTECPAILTLNMDHGDFFLMTGDTLQTYYEHSVKSTDMARIVMTCRRITPTEKNKADHWMGEFDPSILTYRGNLDGNPKLGSDWTPIMIDGKWVENSAPEPHTPLESSSEAIEADRLAKDELSQPFFAPENQVVNYEAAPSAGADPFTPTLAAFDTEMMSTSPLSALSSAPDTPGAIKSSLHDKDQAEAFDIMETADMS